MDKIDLCRREYKEWCENLGLSGVSQINRLLNGGSCASLINLSETRHEQKISDIAKIIATVSENIQLIFISGPSSSGKTSFAQRLMLHLRVLGVTSVSISLDNYYKKPELMPKNRDGKPDFEAFDSIDHQRFNEDIAMLLKEGCATVPIFDFLSGSVSKQNISLGKKEVIIVEGIHGLNDGLAYNIPSQNKYKIYCSPLSALTDADGQLIKSRKIRFMRRLVRDFYFRNADYKLSFELWPYAEEGAKKNIFPFAERADVIFNSSLVYEAAVYYPHLKVIFKDVPTDFENYDTVCNLLSLSESFGPINTEAIPPSSIIKEFIGGSSLFN